MNKEEKAKQLSPVFGIAAVWFGTHVGPGVASGKQVTSYYLTYGKLGLITPIIAMGIMGLIIYYVMEYARLNGLHNFKSFTMKFFAPYEKLFSIFFEVSFLMTALIAPGLCIATAAELLQQFFGLNVWIGTILIAAMAIFLVMYGAELVKKASTALTVGILAILAVIVIMGLNVGKEGLAQNWATTSIGDVSLLAGLWMATTYLGFQSTGIIGNCISVSEGLRSKKDSLNVALLGTLLNATMLVVIVLVNFAFMPESLEALLPNFHIVQQIGFPILEVVYVLFVVMASLSTIITFAFSVVARFGNNESLKERVKDPKKRNLLLVTTMIVLDIAMSAFGIVQLINVGYRMLGYFCIVLVVVPFLVVGIKKAKSY